jgi:hypothetical protein
MVEVRGNDRYASRECSHELLGRDTVIAAVPRVLLGVGTRTDDKNFLF